MQSADLNSTRTFLWTQSRAGSREYVLTERGTLAGVFRKEGMTASSAVGEAGEHRWKFEHRGIWHKSWSITDIRTGIECARYESRWAAGTGVLTFADGASFTWGTKSVFSQEYCLKDSAGRVVLASRRGVHPFKWGNAFKQQATSAVVRDGHDGQSLVLLLMISWWLMLIEDEETALVASTAAIG